MDQMLSAIAKLEANGILVRSGDDIKILVKEVHLPRESPVFYPWLNQIKLFSAHKISTLSKEKVTNFSVAFAADVQTRNKIHERFLEFLQEIEHWVKTSRSRELYQMTFELFPWTDQ